MKKLFSCILAILILAFSVVPCFAEEETPKSASLSISASSTAVNEGDTITLTVKVSEGLRAISLTVKYSSEFFSYVGDSSGGTFANYEPSSGTAGTFSCTAYENESGAGGTVATVTLKVNKVPSGNGATISATATGNGGAIPVSGSSVTIKCGHKETEKVEVKHSTCSEAGRIEEKCKVCGATGLNPTEIAKLPHTYGAWEIVEMPTQYTQGKQKRVCTVCNYIDIQPVNVNGETPNEPETETNTEFPSYPFYQEEENEYNTTPTPKPNNNGNYRPEQKDDEEVVEKKGLAALFASSSDVSDSDKAAILVVGLAVLIVVVLVIYLLLLKQRKKE